VYVSFVCQLYVFFLLSVCVYVCVYVCVCVCVCVWVGGWVGVGVGVSSNHAQAWWKACLLCMLETRNALAQWLVILFFLQSDGSRYEGEWNNGQMQGKGIQTFAKGDRYVVSMKQTKEKQRSSVNQILRETLTDAPQLA
jgi:hypothetical protein